LEIERRWLVDPERLPALDEATVRRIDDLYLDGGRLRLRAITHPDGRAEFKLCKKYERDDPLAGPITNLYLSAEEHAAFAGLPGRRVRKRRYPVDGFSVDVFDDGLILAEREFESLEAAQAAAGPVWALREVTDDPAYTGWALASLP
jgi:CYTH domain-containing protein